MNQIRLLLVLVFGLIACSSIEQRSSPQPVTDAMVETAPRTSVTSSEDPAMGNFGFDDLIDASAQTPATERAVGYAAMAAGLLAMTLVVIGIYKFVKLWSP